MPTDSTESSRSSTLAYYCRPTSTYLTYDYFTHRHNKTKNSKMSSDEESISGEEATSEEEEVEQQVATKKKRKSKKKVRRQGLPVHLLLPFAPSCT